MKRIDREKLTVEEMIKFYCHHHHGRKIPCPHCQELLEYSQKRLDFCPFALKKSTCGHCLVHCYSVKMREQIKEVMRFAGPRMIFRHPLLALGHQIDVIRDLIVKILPPPHWRLPVLITLAVFLGIGLYLLNIYRALSYLSDSPETCINCHVMNPEYATESDQII